MQFIIQICFFLFEFGMADSPVHLIINLKV